MPSRPESWLSKRLIEEVCFQVSNEGIRGRCLVDGQWEVIPQGGGRYREGSIPSLRPGLPNLRVQNTQMYFVMVFPHDTAKSKGKNYIQITSQ